MEVLFPRTHLSPEPLCCCDYGVFPRTATHSMACCADSVAGLGIEYLQQLNAVLLELEALPLVTSVKLEG